MNQNNAEQLSFIGTCNNSVSLTSQPAYREGKVLELHDQIESGRYHCYAVAPHKDMGTGVQDVGVPEVK